MAFRLGGLFPISVGSYRHPEYRHTAFRYLRDTPHLTRSGYHQGPYNNHRSGNCEWWINVRCMSSRHGWAQRLFIKNRYHF